jgi:hypothetical protein
MLSCAVCRLLHLTFLEWKHGFGAWTFLITMWNSLKSAYGVASRWILLMTVLSTGGLNHFDECRQKAVADPLVCCCVWRTSKSRISVDSYLWLVPDVVLSSSQGWFRVYILVSDLQHLLPMNDFPKIHAQISCVTFWLKHELLWQPITVAMLC